ncbi:Acetyltransferase (GNAT) family protein [Rhizobiales bacterium GAS113]|nr:Acetyltransferase (GNAT) family protein [Rhizobiales bacterium GAS113]
MRRSCPVLRRPDRRGMNKTSRSRVRPNAIRKLFASEEPLFRDHLLRLDPSSRHDRFLRGVADEFLIEYAERCFASDTLVLGLVDEDHLRAAGELHATERPDDLTAEVAFSVEPAFRNRGIGKALLKRLIVFARNRGVRHLRMNCHPQNFAMLALARRFNAEFTIEQASVVGDITPPSATPLSLLAEALDNACDIAKAAIDIRRRS